MNGKYWSLPLQMVFGKYYCTKCGEKLEREKTHRVVTPEDKDYYDYHDYGAYPQNDYDVYGYQFACPHCGKRVAYREQRILARIQKKQETRVLAASEIKANYAACKAEEKKHAFLISMLLPAFIVLMDLIAAYAAYLGGKLQESFRVMVLVLLSAVFITLYNIVSYKGVSKLRSFYKYSYEEKALLERLHAYCTGNRDLIARANRCYCFYCKAEIDKREIVDFADQGKTAICPKCDVDAILPDSIGEPIDETLLTQLHDYWF